MAERYVRYSSSLPGLQICCGSRVVEAEGENFCEAGTPRQARCLCSSSSVSASAVGGPSVVDHPSVRALVVAPRRVPAQEGVRRERTPAILRLFRAAQGGRALIVPVTLQRGSTSSGVSSSWVLRRSGRCGPAAPHARRIER